MQRLAARLLVFVCALSLGACAASVQAPSVVAAPKAKPVQDSELYLSVIGELIKNGQAYAALANLDQYDHQFGASNRSRKLRADALLKIGKTDEAETLYRGLVATPLEADAWNGLGRIAAKAGKWQQAVGSFRKASNADPTRADFLSNLGYALIQTHAYADAEFALRKARQLAPDDRRIANNVALLIARSDQEKRLAEFFPHGGQSVGLTPKQLQGLVSTYREQAGS